MKICFIGHLKHTLTKSSEFFFEIFKDYEIDKYFFDKTNYKEQIEKIDYSKYDLAICWQYDFLAPMFLARNIPTVIVPMYDGSSGYNDRHWKILKKARVLNFSFFLNQKCKQIGLETLLVRYFLNPDNYKQADFSNGYHGFLWQRKPSDINWPTCTQHILKGKISTGCEYPLKSFHVHLNEDNPKGSVPEISEEDAKRFNITTSTWFENKNELNNILDNSNIYFAPRVSEGIGMGVIEALTRGMFVIANDAPTHNEYIANWINGVLCYYSKPTKIELIRAKEIGQRARESCYHGYKKWITEFDKIKNFVLEAKKPNVTPSKSLIKSVDKIPEVLFEAKGYHRHIRKYLLNSQLTD